MTKLTFQPIHVPTALTTLHGAGLGIRAICDATDLSYQQVRGRGRRLGLRWTGPEAKGSTGDYYLMSEERRQKRQREDDERFVIAMAHAFRRGEHLPTAVV